MRTFEEYKKFVSKTQKDKDKNTVILYSNDAEKQDSYIEDAKKRNYDVVLFDNVMIVTTSTILNKNLTKYDKRVDADILDKLIDKDEKKETVIRDEDKESLKNYLKKLSITS